METSHDALQTAINLTPDFVEAHVRLGEAYLIGMASAKDAIKPLERALRCNLTSHVREGF